MEGFTFWGAGVEPKENVSIASQGNGSLGEVMIG